MFKLDMRTALFSYLLISLISSLLAGIILKQFSNRYKGAYHLFFCFLLQAITLLLILLRGLIPDWISFDLSNSLSIGGIILFLTGIEIYTGQRSSLKPNLILLTIFIAVHIWFTFIQPDLSVRHLNVSVAWLVLFLQASILLLFRIPRSGVKRIFPLTLICIAFCLVSAVRIVKFFVIGHPEDYFQSDLFDTVIIILCQILLILLMFSLAYLFGARLVDDVRAEEEKFYRIFHTSPYAILLTRLKDGTILEANKVFLEKTHYSYDEIIGKTSRDLKLWADYMNRATVVSALENNETVSGKEILVRTKTGELITVLLSSELISVNDEVCIFSSFEDITGRKQIENEKEELFRSLVESEEKCRSFFINSLDANFLTAPDGTVFSANPAACLMLGYTEEEICRLGRNHLADTSDPRLASALAERDSTGKFSGELTMIRKNGEKFPVELSSVVFSNRNGKKMTSMIVRDITERKLAEKKLHEASFYTRNLIEASLDPFLTINIDGIISDVNRSAEHITGKSRDHLIGSRFMDHFTRPDLAKEGYLTVFKNGLVRDYPLSILHKSGLPTHVLFNATLFRDEAGEIKGVFAVARDISERLRIEDDLKKSKELLEILNQHLIDVRENERKNIAMALHDDLGQRLTGMYLDVAWLKSKLNGQPDAVMKKIDQLISMVLDTIENVKETSSMLRPSILTELGLIPAIKSHLRKSEEQSGINYKFSCDPGHLDLDERTSLVIYRVFQESVTNITRHSLASNAEVNLRLTKAGLEMNIHDNGRGIPPDMINSFGSLGLAGMRERIRAVRGKLDIRGEAGKGSVISVFIPLNSESFDNIVI